MNRRKFLSLTIGGVAAGAAGATEFPLANSPSAETQSLSSATASIRVSDREKAELRGPARTCAEETSYSNGRFLTTTEYSLDGKLLTTRTLQSDGSEWVTSQTYDVDGRLVKIASGKLGEPGTETLYAYDEAGRLLSITNSPEKGNRIDFRYDERGRRTAIQSFDPKTPQRNQGTLFAGSPWGAAQLGFGFPAGGNVTTIYDENDQPAEAQIHDAAGQLVSRFVRTYDANGRIMEENQIQENPALLMERAELNDKQFEAMNKVMKSMLSGKHGTGKSYTYDAQGRVTEVRDRNPGLDTVTTTSYNEHGDKSEERMTRTDNTFFPLGDAFSMDENGTLIPDERVSNAPSVEEPPKLEVEETNIAIEYRYVYDQYGNWTEQTVVHRSGSNEYSNVRHRALTYY